MFLFVDGDFKGLGSKNDIKGSFLVPTHCIIADEFFRNMTFFSSSFNTIECSDTA
jgi:hypothetical protein